MDLLVTLSGPRPGSALDRARTLAAAADVRGVPLTLLVAPPVHPETARWAAERRCRGDTVLLHGLRPDQSHRRLPAHEAGLQLVAARRGAEAHGLVLDGFAAPGWACSEGVRRALGEAGLDLLVDDTGLHRLGPDGARAASRWTRRPRGAGRRRRSEADLQHVALSVADGPEVAAARLGGHPGAAGRPTELVAAAPRTRTPAPALDRADPEHWSITA